MSRIPLPTNVNDVDGDAELMLRCLHCGALNLEHTDADAAYCTTACLPINDEE